MVKRYIDFFKTNFVGIIFISLVLCFLVMLFGLMNDEFDTGEPTIEYELTDGGVNTEIEGDLYQYNSLSQPERETFNSLINGERTIQHNRSNNITLPDTTRHTIQKGDVMYVIDVTKYNKKADMYVMILIILGSLCAVLFEHLFLNNNS